MRVIMFLFLVALLVSCQPPVITKPSVAEVPIATYSGTFKPTDQATTFLVMVSELSEVDKQTGEYLNDLKAYWAYQEDSTPVWRQFNNTQMDSIETGRYYSAGYSAGVVYLHAKPIPVTTGYLYKIEVYHKF